MLRVLFYLLAGATFGFILSRSGATGYDAIADMFLLRDFQLYGVIGVAILTAGLGFWLARRLGLRAVGGQPLALGHKPLHAGNLWGGLVFGAGWALSGSCPGTALAMVGEGDLVGLFIVPGMLAGALLYRKTGARLLAWLPAPAFLAPKRASGA